MVRPARRFTELNTCSGPTRSSSSTGGTTRTIIRRFEGGRREPTFLEGAATRPLPLWGGGGAFASACRISTDLCRKSTCPPSIAWQLIGGGRHEGDSAAVHAAHTWLYGRQGASRRAGCDRGQAGTVDPRRARGPIAP